MAEPVAVVGSLLAAHRCVTPVVRWHRDSCAAALAPHLQLQQQRQQQQQRARARTKAKVKTKAKAVGYDYD